MHCWKKSLLVLLIVIIVLYLGIMISGTASSVANSLAPIKYYVEQTGKFPESLSSWEKSGYLKKYLENGRTVYEVRVYPPSSEEERWKPFVDFEKFTFAYGVSVDQLELRNNVLYDKRTGSRIFLIKGKGFFFSLYRPMYTKYSKELYEIMKSKKAEIERHESSSK